MVHYYLFGLMLGLIEILTICLLKMVRVLHFAAFRAFFVCDGSGCFILSLVMVIKVN